MKYLNLGCGNRYLPDWINIDFVRTGRGVLTHNLLEGIPFEDDTFDVVYHSHVLEHFGRRQGVFFFGECFRVLKPGGILRVVVPDLEALAIQYLAAINNRRQIGDQVSIANHEWAIIELIDQMVRTESGGEMARYWRQPHIINESTLEARLGHEFTNWRASCLAASLLADQTVPQRRPALSVWQQLKGRWRWYWLRRWGLQAADIRMLQFLRSGERHLWMYDELSLRQLLEETGFGDVMVTDAFHSQIPRWVDYQMLDVELGKTRKPDSLFVEAKKP
jgi:SAM-dependent methyltransferase